ncbi:MAG: glycosyltransferase family 2 protein, partial [Desulfobulbus sp.]
MISVILPTYNRAAFLERSIGSVLGQRLACDELIVVDDGSTDATVAVVEQIAADSPVPLRLLRQENRGAAAARNAGIRAAGGELLAFLDSDDWWLPAKL